MKDRYQIAVSREAQKDLKFPGKCAYCLESSPLQDIIIKHKHLKGVKLKVPYCKTHSTMIRSMKILDRLTLSFGALLALSFGIYLHNRSVIVIGNTGFNFLAAQLIGVVISMAVLLLIQRLVLRLFFAGKGSLDEDGAVKIVMVYADAFVLQFHDKFFATEFGQLNYPTPTDQDANPVDNSSNEIGRVVLRTLS